MKRNIYMVVLALLTVACIIGGSMYWTAGIGRNIVHSLTGRFYEGDSDFGKGVTLDREELEEFSQVIIDTSVMDVTVVRGEGYTLSYQCSKKFIPEYSVDNGVLTIKQNDKRIWGFGINNQYCDLTLTIPSDVTLQELEVDSSAGEIQIQDISMRESSFHASVGDIRIQRSDLGNSEFDVSTGDIDLDKVTFKDLTIDNSVGDVKINSSQDLSDYSMELSTSVGEVTINGDDHGNDYDRDADSEYEISVDNSTGDIRIDY